MADVVRAGTWIFERLGADAELMGMVEGRIFNGMMPIDSGLPAVLFAFQAARRDLAVRKERIGSRLDFLVRVVAEGAALDVAEAAAQRLDALLQGASQAGTVEDGRTIVCVRRQPVSYLEATAQGGYRAHLGGLYELLVQAN